MNRITRVSKVFYTLIDNSPPMWSILSSTHPKNLARMALSKSKPSPLTVEIIQYANTEILELLDAVSNQTHRIYSLNLVVGSDISKLKKISRPSAPLLERLTLQTTARRQRLDVELFAGGMPCLRQLELHGALLKMEWERFSRLVSLKLIDQDAGALPISKVLQIVASNPLLETLVLEKIPFASTEALQDKGQQKLPHLTKLRLVALPAAATTTFLTLLTVPNCKKLEIRRAPHHWTSTSTDYFEGSLKQFSSLLRSTNETREDNVPMEIDLGKNEVSFRFGDIQVDLLVANPYETLEWIASTLNGSRITRKCTLKLNHDLILKDHSLYTWLDKWPCITTLRLEARRPAKEIINRHEDNCRGILKMVRTRYGEAGPPAQPNNRKGKDGRPKMPNLPPPLTLLHLRNVEPYDHGVYRELVRLVGREHLVWGEADNDDSEDDDDGTDEMGGSQDDDDDEDDELV